MFDYDPSPYEVEHSLIQKAVRRGSTELVEKVFNYLIGKGQRNWLKNRLVVIAYEECWTYANELDISCSDHKLLQQFLALASTVKNKNADGLADLALKLYKGKDVSNVGSEKDQKAIKSVSNAIDNQDKYWNWIGEQPKYKKFKQRIDAAKKDIKRATYDNDKVMMSAAAYLSIRYPIPKTKFAEPDNDPEFPYWIAIDKHTAIGREIYTEVCEKINLNVKDGMKLGFYLEGAKVNQITDSSFWDYIKEWQLKQMNYTLEDAQKTWDKLSEELKIMRWFNAEVQDLTTKINTTKKPDQLSLSLFE